ncbi:wd40 repeat protein [Holotrichia oblita]|uniref:Wd40 repeat protein n=1 Tax=Holotrichia oblita TaxID=644536 RepID=A0ACB9STD8_HOLOL|nr:wd40 repeat protein [Holotrichia oblita]
MKFSYKFSNLLGTVYREGDLLFTPDGNSVISPVGNRISIFDLRSNKATTLPIESKYNYNALDISPNGCTLIAINEQGDAHMISLISQTVVHKYRFKRKVNAVKFSPDGKHFAVCKENNVFHAAYDETTCVDWSSDSKVIAVGSKDMTVKLYPLDKWSNFKIYSLGSHTDSIVSCFFENNSLDLISISKNGQMCVWESSMETSDFKLIEAPPSKKQKSAEDSDEDDIDVSKVPERTEEELASALKDVRVEDNDVGQDKLYYKRIARHYLGDAARKDDRKAMLTSASYHKTTKVLVTGFSSGAFFIHEMPECNLIHSLSISEQEITSISLNSTADWIALGCSGFGQLLVWEWQSETYVLKQQGHSNNMTCVAYSIDGQLLGTGGEDGKVKLWNVHSGFCFVTFQEHTNASGLAFSPTPASTTLASVSWDKTLKVWDAIEKGSAHETIELLSDGLCVAFNPNGQEVAVGTLDSQITIFNVRTAQQMANIEGRDDLGSGRSDTDLITAKQTLKAKSFTTLCYTADGNCILAGGQSKNVCIYNVKEGIILKKFEITQNRSLDAVDDFINRRKMTEYGNVALIEEREVLEGGHVSIKLPGVRKGDMAARSFKPEVRVFSLQFSPTGQAWAAATTEGLLVYSLTPGLMFDPWNLQMGITPTSVREAISNRDHTNGLY